MKHNKIISAALAVGMVFSLAACGDGQSENSNKGSDNGMTKIILPDYDLKKDDYELKIGGWLIPSNLDENNVKWIKEAGVNVMHAVPAGDNATISFNDYDEKAKKTLDLLGDNGIGVYVNTLSREGNRKIQGEQSRARNES